jgi:hypothetical protein
MLGYHTQTTATIGADITFLSLLDEEEKPKIPNPQARNTSVWLALNFKGEIESGTTQEFAGTQVLRLAPPTYDEEDVLNWDVAITPPPRPSGIIRVKLKFKGRKKPMPIDNPWEE